MSLRYARMVLNQEDRPLWPKELPRPKVAAPREWDASMPSQFIYSEPYTSNEIYGACFRLERQLTEQDNLRRAQYVNGRRIEIPLTREQLRLFKHKLPGRARRPVIK